MLWLGAAQRASDFTARVYRSPFADTAMRPLTLAHLCAIEVPIDDVKQAITDYRKKQRQTGR
jgi:hypothetical protein